MAELEVWKILLTLSYLLLGAVLFYRRFYWCYGCLYCLVAVFNYLYPIEVASLLPYILALCVCYVLGTCGYSALQADQCKVDSNLESNVENCLPLYIGERTSCLLVKNNRIGSGITERVSQLEKMDKCILAAKVPIDNGPVKDNKLSGRSRRFNTSRYNYLVIQGISREIRRGQNRPLDTPLSIPDTEINQNYRLNHVGWYNHRSDIPEVIRNGPRIPGYQCSESAMNVALQTSNSTVYTYFKCMMSYRPRSIIKYLLLLCCPVIYQCCAQPVTTVLSPVIPVTAIIINFIAVIEINVLQVGQRFAFIESILTMVRGCVTFCHCCVAFIKYIVHNLFVVFIVVAIGVSIYYHAEDPHEEVDLTREPEAAGPEVADTVIRQIEIAKIFDNDHMHDYIRRIARVESNDGLDNTTYRDGYHGGLCQVDEVLFLVTQNTSYPILIDKHRLVKMKFDIDWLLMQWKDLRAPLWSCLATCLYMCTVNEEIPSSIKRQAGHWDKYYRSKKESPHTATEMKNATEEFVVKVKDFEANTSVCYRDIDLFIVLDSSGSITKEKYEIAKKFVVDLVSGFTISESNVQVGMVIYGSTVQSILNLDESFDRTVVVNKIRNIPYLDSGTATGDAIMRMVKTGFTEANGARPPKFAIPRVGIVLTDGESNTGSIDVRTAAQTARDKSIEMFAFGIGQRINDKELLEIAGSQERKFKIDSFDNIDDARALIARGSCKAGIKAAMDTRYEDNLDRGKSRLFEYAVPEEGITVQVQVTEGKITLYGSHSNPEPSPVWHDYVLSGIHGDKEIFISHETFKGKHVESTAPFYCNLIGEENSTFSVKAVNGTD